MSCQLFNPSDEEQGPVEGQPTPDGVTQTQVDENAHAVATNIPAIDTPIVDPDVAAERLSCPENAESIVFARDIAEPGEGHNFEVFSIKPDGSGEIQLTDHNGYDGYPSWSPDHCQIAFSSNIGDQNEEIYIMNFDGSGLFRVTNDPYKNKMPTRSPDGQRIAYESERDGQGDIFIINIDGSNLFQLTNNPAEDQWLEWSPDGERIAFSSRRDDNWEIYVINADGIGLTNITNHPKQESHPTWSPDGERIAFFSNRTAYVEIFIMNADGSNVSQITTFGSSFDINGGKDLAWSSDGRYLVFIGTSADAAVTHNFEDVFVINIDGSGLVNLTNNPNSNSNPDW